jgi:hypothetical protein
MATSEDDFLLNNGLFDNGGSEYTAQDWNDPTGESQAQAAYQSNPDSFQSNWADQYLQTFYASGGSSVGSGGAGKPGESAVGGSGSPSIASGADQKQEESLWDRITGFGNKNKNNPLLQMGLMGIAGHFKGEQNKEAAEKQQEYKMAQMNHAAQIDRDKIAANSASVSGITPVNGLIQKALQRKNGQAVFQPNGRVAR